MTARLKTQRRRGDGRGALQGAGAVLLCPGSISAPAPRERRRPHCSLGVVAAGGRRGARREAAVRTAAAAHSHLLALRAVGDGPRRAPGLAADRALGAAREVRDDARAAEGVRAVQLDRIVRDVHADRAAPVAVRVVRLHRLERHRRRSGDRRRLLAGRAGRGAGAAAALSAHESRTPTQAATSRSPPKSRGRTAPRERGAVNAEPLQLSSLDVHHLYAMQLSAAS